MKIYRLLNEAQNYAWGDTKFIPNLLGIKNKKNQPYAELWMGANPSLPSKVIEGDQEMLLDQLIEADPEFFLGDEAAKKFSNNLPFLLKVLSAGSPLSIQAHPNKDMAEKGFARENELNIPLDAPFRSYKDNNHKPEIICALTQMSAMKGFRQIFEIVENMNRTEIDELIILASGLDKDNPEESLKTFFKAIFEFDKETVKYICDKLEKSTEKSLAFTWVRKLLKVYPYDIGVLAPLYLNVVELEPSEALYLGAGELHAYLEGSGMELMANSDNVLRGGLTSKHIDLDELISILEFTPSKTQIIHPVNNGEELVFETPSNEFVLSEINIDGIAKISAKKVISIYICVEGSFEAKDFTGTIYKIEKGNSFLTIPGDEAVEFSGKARVYRASIPNV